MNQSPIITALISHVTSECRAVDREAAYRALLDDSGPVEIAGLTFSPSQIIENLDETAFRCGVNDYADGQDWTEVDGETYENRDLEAARESFADIKREEITEKENEISEIDQEAAAEDVEQARQLVSLNDELTALQAELTEIEGYAF